MLLPTVLVRHDTEKLKFFSFAASLNKRVAGDVKVDSYILRYDAARQEAVRQDAAKTHGCCSHMQRLPL